MAALQAQTKGGASEKKSVDERSNASKQVISELLRLFEQNVADAAHGVALAVKARDRIERAIDNIEQANDEKVPMADMLPPLRRLLALVNDYFLGCRTTAGKEFASSVTDVEKQVQLFALAVSGALLGVKDSSIRRDILNNAQAVGSDFASLMGLVVAQRKDSDKYQDALIAISEAVPKKMERLLASARRAPGAGELELAESTLENLASQEMLNAAQQIQDAAEMLMNIQHDESVEIDESDLAASVLGRARNITQATIELMRAAVAAQQEVNRKGGAVSREDPNWAQGLMSAAKLVALTSQDLVAAANLVAKGQLQEDAIIAIARTVGGATARLNAAAKARLDAGSSIQKQLADASNKINAETKELTREAQQAMEDALRQEEKAKVSEKKNAFAARAERLEGQEKVNALTRQLDNAYRQLKIVRQKEKKFN